MSPLHSRHVRHAAGWPPVGGFGSLRTTTIVKLRYQRGDRADRGKQRSQDRADSGYGHRNFDECVAVLVLYDDALDVALVDQFADLIHQVAAQDMNFFDDILESP